MAKDTGRGITSTSRHIVTVAVIFLLLLPVIAMASTPPVQPSLILKSSSSDVHSDMPLTLSVSWNRFGIPFHVPPTNIILEVFLVPDGILVAKFLIPPAKGTCGSEDMCKYQITINSADIPAGNLMLIATDPLSEAFDRQMITVTGQGAGFPSLHAMIVRDRLFLGISVILACILCAILTGLIRKSG